MTCLNRKKNNYRVQCQGYRMQFSKFKTESIPTIDLSIHVIKHFNYSNDNNKQKSFSNVPNHWKLLKETLKIEKLFKIVFYDRHGFGQSMTILMMTTWIRSKKAILSKIYFRWIIINHFYHMHLLCMHQKSTSCRFTSNRKKTPHT